MKEKLHTADDQIVRQETWVASPCSECLNTPCCQKLPLDYIRVKTRQDLLEIALLLCYDNIEIGLKRNGEWTVYDNSPCSFLSKENRQCLIHGMAHQSLICKTYDAHSCWYKKVFLDETNTHVISLSLSRFIQFEQHFQWFNTGFLLDEDVWQNMQSLIQEEQPNLVSPSFSSLWEAKNTLAYKDCSSSTYLFFPPRERPHNEKLFDFMLFRLSFPNLRIGVSDNMWVHLLKSRLDTSKLNTLQEKYCSWLQSEQGAYSFASLNRKTPLFSSIGQAWILLQREHILPLKQASQFNRQGQVTMLPTTKKLLHIIRTNISQNPNKSA